MTSYAWAHIAHLLCALVFVGGVLFEALILSALHRPEVGRETRREAERAIAARAVRVMPRIDTAVNAATAAAATAPRTRGCVPRSAGRA